VARGGKGHIGLELRKKRCQFIPSGEKEKINPRTGLNALTVQWRVPEGQQVQSKLDLSAEKRNGGERKGWRQGGNRRKRCNPILREAQNCLPGEKLE